MSAREFGQLSAFLPPLDHTDSLSLSALVCPDGELGDSHGYANEEELLVWRNRQGLTRGI
jgi:hypothetical protein